MTKLFKSLKMSYTFRGTTYYIQPKTNYLMMKGGTRPDGSLRKDRRVKETFFKTEVLQTYVAPPLRDETFDKIREALGTPNAKINQNLFKRFVQPTYASPTLDHAGDHGNDIESLSITIDNDQRSTVQAKTTLSIEAPEFQPKSEEVNNNCICQRPDGLVVCGFCGSYCIGRLAKICNVHPETGFEEDDVDICPICSQTKYLNDHDYPKQR